MSNTDLFNDYLNSSVADYVTSRTVYYANGDDVQDYVQSGNLTLKGLLKAIISDKRVARDEEGYILTLEDNTNIIIDYDIWFDHERAFDIGSKTFCYELPCPCDLDWCKLSVEDKKQIAQFVKKRFQKYTGRRVTSSYKLLDIFKVIEDNAIAYIEEEHRKDYLQMLSDKDFFKQFKEVKYLKEIAYVNIEDIKKAISIEEYLSR